MAKIKILAGDFPNQNGLLISGNTFKFKTHEHTILGEKIPTCKLYSIKEISRDEAKRVLGTVGMGFLGSILLGPIGLIAGLLCGGKKNTIIFKAEFNDGRRFMGECKKKVFNKLQAVVF